MKLKTFATSRSPFFIFFLIAAVAIIYLFYASSVREHVENYLYDARVSFKPKNSIPNIVIIAIDEPSIEALAPPTAPDATSPSIRNISYATLLDLTHQALRSQAREVVVMAFSNIFSNDAPEVEDLKALVRENSRLTVGTLGLYNNLPSGIELPSTFASIDDRVYGVDMLRKRSNSVVRWLPLHGYQGQTLKPLLPYYVAKKILTAPILKEGNPDTGEGRENGLSWYMINYTSPAHFQQLPAKDFLAEPSRYMHELDNKIVLIGYTAYRDWPTQTREPMVVNTPLQGQVDTYKKGSPIIYLTANGIDNLLRSAWLQPVPVWINVVQVLIVSACFGFIWVFGIVPATISIFAIWLFLLYGHGYVFEYGHRFVPLSDTALFSSFALILGALWRLNTDVKAQTQISAKTEAKAELAALQSSFLDRFAFELAALNDELMRRLKAVTSASESQPTSHSLIQRAIASSADFAEYLEGIKQSAAVEGRNLYRPVRGVVGVKALIEQLTSRFETKIEEKRLSVQLDCPEHLRAMTDAKLLDTIIYNLLSNAIKYSSNDKNIKISVRSLGSQRLLVSVQDEGPGIARENLDLIFEKFYRVKDDQVYAVKGTGLGLYLCRYFAEQINARIWCESVVGSGSTFYLEVERAKA